MNKGRPEKRPPRPKAPPVAPQKGPGARPNPKLAEQRREVLGKHYANKYRTTRRG